VIGVKLILRSRFKEKAIMKKKSPQNGFTLVELAIVMTIIGLLIGGILKGQELMQNARVTSTIAQVRAYEAAVTTFRDKYDALPGDFANALTRLPNCTAACNPAAATAGDSIVGDPTWEAGLAYATQSGSSPALLASVRGETVLFWVHLLMGDLIGGVTNAALTGGAATWGETHPAAKIGGGFIVGWGDGKRGPGAPVGVVGNSGLVVALVLSPTTGTVASMSAASSQPLTPTRAAQMDRKMDDGVPATGSVQAYGLTASCFSASGGSYAYLESVSQNDCGLIFRLQ